MNSDISDKCSGVKCNDGSQIGMLNRPVVRGFRSDWTSNPLIRLNANLNEPNPFTPSPSELDQCGFGPIFLSFFYYYKL